jgi:hypothetical protein
VGCEFAGKTTLANEIVNWSERSLGGSSHFHDHFTIPSSELTGDASVEYKNSHPQIKEMFQRFMMTYHASSAFYENPDHNLMGFHIEEAVYAPIYYGYGGENSAAPMRSPEGQRTKMARHMEEEILKSAPEVVLVLMKASPEVIKQRMRENVFPSKEITDTQSNSKPFGEPTRGVVQDSDVEFVLDRFQEEFKASLIKNKIILDTSSLTLAETMAEFLGKMGPFHTETDRIRMRRYNSGHTHD